MTGEPESLLTEEERDRLERGALDDAGHRALDAEVGYRIRLLAAQPGRIDSEAVLADVRLLAETGHNATVSLAYGRLGDHLPARNRS